MINDTDAFDAYIEAATTFWRAHDHHDQSRGVIIVDLSHDWIEYILYSLLIAKFLQPLHNASIVATWIESSVVRRSCPQLDRAIAERCAAAFGVSEFRPYTQADFEEDYSKAFGSACDALSTSPFNEKGVPDSTFFATYVAGANVNACAYESTLRSNLVPSVRAINSAFFGSLMEAIQVQMFLESLFSVNNVVAVVTGHLDYNPWRLLCDNAATRGADVYYFFAGTTLSLWKLAHRDQLPWSRLKAQATGKTFAACRNDSEAEYHYRYSASHSPMAGYDFIPVSMQSGGARELTREFALSQLPATGTANIVTIFSHTFSDIPLSDEQSFFDLEEWLAKTLEYAAHKTDTFWIVKAHPLDAYYDKSALFDRLKARYARLTHILFLRSELTLAELLALSTATVTVRGTIGIQSVAAGIPCILAGRSPYTEARFSTVFLSPDEYFEALAHASNATVSTEARATARALMHFESRTAVLSSTALPPLASSFIDLSNYLHAAAANMRSYSLALDPCAGSVRTLAGLPEGRAVNIAWDSERPDISRNRRPDPVQTTSFLRFASGHDGQAWIVGGFHAPQEGGVWANRRVCAVLLPMVSTSAQERRVLTIRGRLLSAGQSLCALDVKGHRVDLPFASSELSTVRIDISLPSSSDNMFALLRFEVSDLFSPAQLGLNADTRSLGFCLHSVAW